MNQSVNIRFITAYQKYQAVWRKANREKIRKYLASYYKANRDKLLLAMSEYRKSNRDKILATKAAWRKANPENALKWRADNRGKIMEYRKATKEKRLDWQTTYDQANLDKKAAREELRRARKRQATIGDLTDISKIYERAQWWRQWFDVAVDHIMPLSKNGTHEASNLQIIYGFENSRKNAKLDYKPQIIFC